MNRNVSSAIRLISYILWFD